MNTYLFLHGVRVNAALSIFFQVLDKSLLKGYFKPNECKCLFLHGVGLIPRNVYFHVFKKSLLKA